MHEKLALRFGFKSKSNFAQNGELKILLRPIFKGK